MEFCEIRECKHILDTNIHCFEFDIDFISIKVVQDMNSFETSYYNYYLNQM